MSTKPNKPNEAATRLYHHAVGLANCLEILCLSSRGMNSLMDGRIELCQAVVKQFHQCLEEMREQGILQVSTAAFTVEICLDQNSDDEDTQ